MSRKLIALLLCLMLACTAAFAETEATANATPAEEQSLRDLAGTEAPEGEAGAEEAVETAAYIPDTLSSESSDRVIVGADNRATVSNPDVYPYSAIAYLVVHARCGCEWTGSSFMVGPRGLVTAAHCIVCTDHHMSADRITMYFGYKSDRNYFYMYNGATTYWYGTDFSYTDSYDDEWDYAYVLLNEHVGNRTGWLGVSPLSDSELQSKALFVAGYRDGVLRYDADIPEVDSANIISYQADTQPGNSGGPVYYFSGSDVYATAINVAESAYSMRNYGRRINSQVFQSMKSAGIFN